MDTIPHYVNSWFYLILHSQILSDIPFQSNLNSNLFNRQYKTHLQATLQYRGICADAQHCFGRVAGSHWISNAIFRHYIFRPLHRLPHNGHPEVQGAGQKGRPYIEYEVFC